MQALRASLTEHFAFPRVFGRWVGRARRLWPVLLGAPILFWIFLIHAFGSFVPARLPLVYADLVPHSLIYVVNFSALGFALAASGVGVARAWRCWGEGAVRRGSVWRALWPVLQDVLLHRRFSSCGTAASRRRGHFLLFWGFFGAALASGFIVLAMILFNTSLPLPLSHWIKLLGNAAALSLLLGVISLLAGRQGEGEPFGRASAFDNFFLGVVVLLVATGVLTEAGRLLLSPRWAISIYIVHLGAVLCLFLTTPYSKLAHALYRFAALLHQRLTAASRA
jgi:hypothetical protein